MEPWLKTTRPKLDRQNAFKNFDYASSSSSSSDSSLRTRSLDIYPTSFRVSGDDGELDLICGFLGLSGPDDFAIPAAEWEALRLRSSSDVSSRARLQHQNYDDLAFRRFLRQVKDDCPSQSDVKQNLVAGFENGRRFGGEVAKLNLISLNKKKAKDVGGGCMYDVRPPVLAPPTGKLRSVVRDVSSTWEIYRSFAPKGDERQLFSPQTSNSSHANGNEARFRDGERNNGGLCEREMFDHSNAGNTTNGDGEELSVVDLTNANGNSVNRESKSVLKAVHYFSPSGKFKRKNSSSWQKGEILGSGSFGIVYEAFTEYRRVLFAVKEVSLLTQGSQGKENVLQLEQEISLLSQFKHENIVQFLGTDKDRKKLYIFLELLTKGSLVKLYQRFRLKESHVSAYTRQILNGLNYLHEQNVVHRDIKCANVLVDASGSVKLADFGLAKAVKLNDVNSCKGTAYWMAPEVVNLQTHGYGLPADIWSLGCTVLEMLTGQPPYSHLNAAEEAKIGSQSANFLLK